MVYLLTGLLFVLLFGIVQGIVYLISGTTPAKEAKKQIEKIKNSQGFIRFVYDKQIQLKKMGAGVLLKDHLTLSQWYLFKALMAGLFGLIAFFISAGVLKSDMAKPISIGAGIIGWFFLDLILRLKNKASNDEMMPDIMEMSRSVLYGKRGGQYIADALKDAVIVVDRSGNIYNSFITDIDFAFLGMTIFKNSAESALANGRSYSSAPAEVLRKAKQMVSHEKTEREKAVEQLQESIENSSGMYITPEEQLDGSVIYYTHNKPTLAESDIV